MAFRTIHLHAADAEHRQHSDRKHDDAEAAQPLQELAVEQDCTRQRVQPGEHGRARGRQPRHRFKYRFGQTDVGVFAQIKRQCAERAEHSPEQHDDKKAVTQAQFTGALAR